MTQAPATVPIRHRFVREQDYDRLAAGLAPLLARAAADDAERRRIGRDRLARMLHYAAERVPACRDLGGPLSELGLAAFPYLTKDDLRQTARRLAAGAEPTRWNHTSGSTNVPVRSALGRRHEENQTLRWLRHWRTFGIDRESELLFAVPRAYRLRLIGGGVLRDLAGGHRVRQLHPADAGRLDAAEPSADAVVANPHVLEHLFPDGWPGRPAALVTSYEQRPAGSASWPAAVHGDVYGLSEVGDIGWQRVGAPAWHLHHDLVHLEILPQAADGPVAAGELVVTDLTNETQPVIRYRTGDLAVARVESGAVRSLFEVAGRRIAARGTMLQGRDLLSTVMPVLLGAGVPFRLGASDRRCAAWLDAGPAALEPVRRRLDRHLPGIVVGDDPSVLHGLRDVLRMPDLAALSQGIAAVADEEGRVP
jgi:hypothetical protein